jgi:hypothetical protein
MEIVRVMSTPLNPRQFPADRLSSSFAELPFFSFSIHDYEAMLPAKGGA